MLKIFKILQLLNPFKLFALRHRLRSLRTKLQFAAFLLAAATALQIHIMPDWLADIIRKFTNDPPAATAPSVAERQETEGFFKGIVDWFQEKKDNRERQPTVSPQPNPQHGYNPPPDFAGGTSPASRQKLFAAYANLNLGRSQIDRLPDSPPPPASPPANVRWHMVNQVLDGDTLVIDGQKVRLIGLDAPESGESDHLTRELERIGARNQAREMLEMGRQATQFARQLAEGRRCWLEYEQQTRDQYGRILAYVHLDNGVNLNEAIVYQGFAKVYLGADFRYMKRYIYLQNESAKQNLGLWGTR